jgi:hypothetical protein
MRPLGHHAPGTRPAARRTIQIPGVQAILPSTTVIKLNIVEHVIKLCWVRYICYAGTYFCDSNDHVYHNVNGYGYLSERKSLAGWRSAPALNPKMRRGLSVLPVMRDGRMNTRTREGLEWFGPLERNTLLHCVLDY